MYLVNPYLIWNFPDQEMSFHVRNRDESDVSAIRSLMQKAYPPPHGPEAVWTERTLLTHLKVFPEGQWVAVSAEGQVVGSATSMRLNAREAMASHTWLEVTGQGLLTTHDPEGDVLYGVNVVVDPDHQGKGLARQLYDARLELARSMGCRWMVAGARIPGYHKVAETMTPSQYVAEVIRGSIFDPTLSKQLKMGFRVWGVLPGYAPDPETLGFAALIIRPVEGQHAI